LILWTCVAIFPDPAVSTMCAHVIYKLITLCTVVYVCMWRDTYND